MTKPGAGNGDDRLEHEHEVVELGAPFAQVFGPEIVDAQLTDFEFRLLVYLRITAARNGHTWISHRQIAKHFGKSVRSIQRAYSDLKAKGFTKSVRRGMGQTNKKYLTAPSSIYGSDRMRHFFAFMRSDTSDADIAFLRRLDNPGKSSSDKNVPTGESDLDSSERPSSDKNVAQEVPEMSSKSGQKCVPLEVDQSEVDLREPDQEIGGAEHHPTGDEDQGSDRFTQMFLEKDSDPDSEAKKKTKGQRYKDHWNSNPHAEDLKNLSDDERQAAVAAVVAAAEEAPPERPEAVKAALKRQVERNTKRILGTAPESEKASEKTRQRHKGRDRDRTGMTTRDLENFYREKMADFLPGIIFEGWGGKELALAKPLIEDFGWKLSTLVIEDVCRNWDSYKERMKATSAYPGINWIYACRSQLFGEMQVRLKKGKAPTSKIASASPTTAPDERIKLGEKIGE